LNHFYCCEDLEDVSHDDILSWTIKELVLLFGWKHCPFCGFRLSSLI